MMIGPVDIGRMIGAACERICGDVRDIEERTDFEAIQKEVRDHDAEKHFENRIVREMAWDGNDLTSKSAFYIVVRNRHDRSLAGLAGARLLDLAEDESLMSFLATQFCRHYGDGEQPLRVDDCAEELSEICGRVAYVADFKVYKPKGLPKWNASDLILAVYGAASLKWNPDWYAGFGSDRNVSRGLSAIYMSQSAPYALRWRLGVDGWADTDHRLNVKSLFALFRDK